MTRKHFRALARGLARVRPCDGDVAMEAQWKRDVLAVARILQKFNSRFDMERFLLACIFWEPEKT